MAMMVTHMSAAAAALAWMFAEWVKYGKPSVLGIVTGMVAGLVAITPASGYVGPAGAMVIGILAGLVCWSATSYMKQVLKVDDSLDVFTVHGAGGILGSILTGVFASPNLGIFSGLGFAEGKGMGGQLWVQLVAVVAVIIYSGVLAFIILKVVDAMVGLRVSDSEEMEGLDLSLHNERGYEL